MIQKRNIGMCIVLSLITCGIYGYYWFYSMTKDAVSSNNRVYNTDPGTALLLNIFTCGIYGIYWNYQMGKALDDIKASRGMMPADRSLIYLILSIFGLGIVSWILIQSELNELANA